MYTMKIYSCVPPDVLLSASVTAFLWLQLKDWNGRMVATSRGAPERFKKERCDAFRSSEKERCFFQWVFGRKAFLILDYAFSELTRAFSLNRCHRLRTMIVCTWHGKIQLCIGILISCTLISSNKVLSCSLSRPADSFNTLRVVNGAQPYLGRGWITEQFWKNGANKLIC